MKDIEKTDLSEYESIAEMRDELRHFFDDVDVEFDVRDTTSQMLVIEEEEEAGNISLTISLMTDADYHIYTQKYDDKHNHVFDQPINTIKNNMSITQAVNETLKEHGINLKE